MAGYAVVKARVSQRIEGGKRASLSAERSYEDLD